MFALAEVSWCRHGGGAGLEVKFWGGDSESMLGAEYIDTHCPVPQWAVDTVDMDTSQATSDVPLSTLMVVVYLLNLHITVPM